MRTKSPTISKINSDKIKYLEKYIDITLELTSSKILLSQLVAICISQAHIIRTICRRSEIEILALHEQNKIRPELLSYINELSDWFFSNKKTQ